MIVPTNWYGIPLRTRKSRHWFILIYYASFVAVTMALGWINHAFHLGRHGSSLWVSGYFFWIQVIWASQLNKYQRERDDNAHAGFSFDRYPIQSLNLNGRLRSFFFKIDERDKEMDYVVYRRAYHIVVIAFALLLIPAGFFAEGLWTMRADSVLFLLIVTFLFLTTLVQVLRIWIQPDDLGDGALHLVHDDEIEKYAARKKKNGSGEPLPFCLLEDP